MTDTHPSPRHFRRIVMIVVATGTLLALLFSCFWFVLPHWAPGVVIRWSPWVEPVVNAGAHLHARGGSLGDLGWDYKERFAEWGEDAFPVLALCLDGPAPLRAAAIDAYRIRVPVGTGHVLYSPAAYILQLSATIIHERGGQWFRVRADERTLAVPLRVHDLGGLAELQDYVSRLGDASHIGRLADGRTRLMAEVRLDGAIPYGVVARILAASGYIQDVPVDFDQPSLSGLAVVCANPPASYLAEEKTLLFDPGGKISRLITIELTQGPGGRIDIREDGKLRPAVEGAAINSLARLQQFRYAFDPRPDYDGFKPNPVVVILATPDVAWSDVVAACEAQFPLRSVMLGHPLDRPETTNPSGDAGGVQGSSSPR